MVIDRIIAGIVLILGGIHITLLYALAEQPPLNEPKPELWVAIVLGIIFILEAATTLRRRSQPITMLWICIALEAMRYVVLIVSEQAANSSSICIAALAYAAIRYTPAPYKQLAAQSAIYTITSAIAYIYMPMPMEGISAPLLLGTIGAATGLAMLVIGIIPGYVVLSNRRLAEAKRQTLLANERTRIARELHDTTAHHLSSIAIQTTAARAVLHANPHAAEQQLEGISTSISKALADVRATVNHLRTPTEAETNRTPQPTLTTIPDLITECQQLGMTIRVTGPGLRDTLTTPDHAPVHVVSVQATGHTTTVHNLTIRHTHNYHVHTTTKQAILVHNTTPAGGCGPDEDELRDAARQLRDEYAASFSSNSRPATVVAAYVPGHGVEDIRVGRSGSREELGPTKNGEPKFGCAEDDAYYRLKEDVDPDLTRKDIRFVEPVRPRTGKGVDPCVRCQTRFDKSQFPPGVKGQKGGAWGDG